MHKGIALSAILALLYGPLAVALTLERVSVTSVGAPANATSGPAAVSGNGRFVAFSSGASDLVPGDTNGYSDVFVRDLVARTTVRVSLTSGGQQAVLDGTSANPSISYDGRIVAFASLAQLTPDDNNPGVDVFVRDRQNNSTVLASGPGGGPNFSFSSNYPVVSANGRFVVFQSNAPLVSADDNNVEDIYIRDLQTGTTSLVSVSSLGIVGTASSWNPSVSADGRYVAFDSFSQNLAPPRTYPLNSDVYIRDTFQGTTVRLNPQEGNPEGMVLWSSLNPAISSDGRFVSFVSNASNLVLGDTNNIPDIFVRDRVLGTTSRVNLIGANGQMMSPVTFQHTISGNGRYVLFSSSSPELIPGDSLGFTDIFVRDILSRTTIHINKPYQGIVGNWDSGLANGGDAGELSFDGQTAVFYSSAENLLPGARPYSMDVYAAVNALDIILSSGFE